MIHIKHPYGFFNIIADTEQSMSWWVFEEKKSKSKKIEKRLGIYKSFGKIEELYEYIAKSHFLSADEVRKMAKEEKE